MKFVCLGYLDADAWEKLSEQERAAFMEECFAYDDELRRGGHFLRGEALQGPDKGVTLRQRDGRTEVLDGPFTETKEVLGGILYLEANDLNHAIQLMSKHPGVRVGPFEVRPADESINQLIAERDKASAS
ncbi:MAG: YciI family protein [Maioricimonas sp. JB045]